MKGGKSVGKCFAIVLVLAVIGAVFSSGPFGFQSYASASTIAPPEQWSRTFGGSGAERGEGMRRPAEVVTNLRKA
jgi:hypothetical protein